MSSQHAFSNSSPTRGFTLIEVMIVVVILGILAAVVVPKIMDRPDQARVVAAQADIRNIAQALKIYRLDNHTYPTTDQGLQALIQKPTSAPLPPNWKSGGYLERLPKDPWGNDYVYECPGRLNPSSYDLISPGPDGKAGSEDDITNVSGGGKK